MVWALLMIQRWEFKWPSLKRRRRRPCISIPAASNFGIGLLRFNAPPFGTPQSERRPKEDINCLSAHELIRYLTLRRMHQVWRALQQIASVQGNGHVECDRPWLLGAWGASRFVPHAVRRVSVGDIASTSLASAHRVGELSRMMLRRLSPDVAQMRNARCP